EIYTQDADEEEVSPQSYPDYLEIRERDDLFTGVVAHAANFFSLDLGGQPEVAFGEVVSGNYFDVLGVRLSRGRGFIPEEDDVAGAPPVVVIGDGLWKRAFASDPDVVGKTLTIKGRPFDIIGVAPPEFTGLMVGFAADAWVPVASDAALSPGDVALDSRGSRWIIVKGRLRPGVTVEQAQAGMDVLATRLAGEYPDTNDDRGFKLIPTNDVRIFPFIDRVLTPVAALLMTVVGLVLVIACTNLANLLLARAVARRKEIAIRLAIGAGRLRLVRQLLTESMLLALMGGVLGLLVAYWTATFLVSFRPPIPVTMSLDLSIDARVLGFTFIISALTGVIFGLVPALQATKPDVVPALKNEAATIKTRWRALGLRNSLVVLQVAVSLVLLIGAGLFVRSLTRAQDIETGFEQERIAIMGLLPDLNDYSAERGRALYDQLRERAGGMPGVEATAIASRLPLGFSVSITSVRVEGAEIDPDEVPEMDYATIGDGYFEAMDIPLLRGRDFGDLDGESTQPVAIISEAGARLLWPGEDAIGKRVRIGGADEPFSTIVGVARDTKVRTLGEDHRPYIYEAFSQDYSPWMTLVVRTSGDPAAILPALRSELQALDETLPIMELKTMTEHLGIMLFAPRMAAVLLGIFGGLAVLLATVGLYGVVAFTASQRTREMGIRVALGAEPIDVVRLVIRQAVALVGVGAAIGVGLAFLATRPLSSLLFGIGASDPVTFGGVTLLLAAVALLASLVPALRAARVDPMVALRQE
ncbi:MAG: ABC transporter permease, partial [Planctomycetota bacterium]